MEETEQSAPGTDGLEETGDYYVLPESAIPYLPEEWRDHVQTLMEDGRAVLKSVDKELSQMTRIVTSSLSLITLKYIIHHLAEFKFRMEMDAFLELDMLTTAFVVTYARLQQGGNGSGFSPSQLPAHLRPVHEEILDLRNKRFAHSTDHHSMSDAMEIEFEDGQFDIKPQLQAGYYIGGRNEWHELVPFIDQMMYDRMQKVLAKLSEKTGYKWTMPMGPPDGCASSNTY